jgi:hypothetical protein
VHKPTQFAITRNFLHYHYLEKNESEEWITNMQKETDEGEFIAGVFI